MRIPTGQFGGVVADPQRAVRAPMDNQIGGAIAAAGRSIAAIADSQIQEQEEMARAKAANALLDHEIYVKTKTQEISDRISRGELQYGDADKVFRDEIESQRPQEVDGLPPAYRESLFTGYKRTVSNAQFTLGRVVESARRAEFKGQFTSALDNLGKLAGMPGADIDKINAQAEALIPLAKQAGIPEDVLGNSIQSLKDRNWTNHAVQRAMEAKDSIEALDQLEKDLTAEDGFYAMRLDTERRNAVLRSVINDRIRIENRQQLDAQRRDAKAEKVIGEMDRHISSGLPFTVDRVLAWGERVKGTAYEEDFRQRIADEEEVQHVMRMPIEQQVSFVQQKEAALMESGDVRDKANVARLKSAVEANVKQLQESPLVFAQNRLGYKTEPLDLMALGREDGASQIAHVLADRMATMAGLQKQYGPQIKMRPFLPQEADFLVKVLDKFPANDRASLFGVLRASFADDKGYLAAMDQIAPDAPVKARAGEIYAKQRSITLEKKWFGTDSVAGSTDVAQTLLIGEDITNRTKGQKEDDGKGRSLFIPPRGAFETAFATTVGDLYRNAKYRSQEKDLETALAYYVGRSAQTGRVRTSPTDIDSKLVKEAIAATVGELINFNDQGTVVAPWGMSTTEFKAKAVRAFERAAKEAGLPPAHAYMFTDYYGLVHYAGNLYTPTLGGEPVFNPKTGRALVIEIADAAVDPAMKVPK